MAEKINKFIIWCIILNILIQTVCLQERIGEYCILRRTQTSGQCKLLSNCTQAVDDLRLHGISPQLCGFVEDVQPVACCIEPNQNERVGKKSRQKCQEYRDYAKIFTRFLGLDPNNCELLNPKLLTSTGNIARPREFPHMAAIGYDGEFKQEWLCAGALISEKFVLTSAYCLYDINFGEPKYIRIGDLNLDSYFDDAMPQDFNVLQIYKYPNFEPPSLYHNIGLLKLDKEAFFNLFVLPACLQTNPTVLKEKAIVTGWGRENFWTDFNPHLLTEIVDIFPIEECRNIYKNVSRLKLKNGILNSRQVCAGPRVTNNTCVMGPGVLQMYNSNVDCTYLITGIASFSKACGTANIPGVFTRVSAYIEWIEGIIWPS